MKHALSAIPLPEAPTWLWTSETHPNQTVLFRARITGLERYEALSVQIAASTRYYAWANDRYLGQGPCPCPWPGSYVDTRTVDDTPATLNLAILVHHYGVKTQSHADCLPGLWCRLLGKREGRWEAIDIPGDAWSCHQQGGWISTRLRRTWATGWMEQFDSAKHPHGWEKPDFDDADWPSASIIERPDSTLLPRLTPPLREWAMPATTLRAAARVSTEAVIGDTGEGQLGKILDEEPWEHLPVKPLQSAWDSGEGIVVNPGDGGLALFFDLGEEVVGQTEFTVKANSGIVDTYGAEVLRDERPWAFRGNAEYATRWLASGTDGSFRTLNYNGFRYLLIVLRPDNSPMHLKALSAWRREADITPTQAYQSDDTELQRLWDVSIRTLQVSTQETSVDCPTREQALFIADGQWNALWLSKLFDEPAFFEHFLEVTRLSQHDNGLMPSAMFSSLEPPHFLLDFCLISVWAVDVFRRAHPERLDTVRRALPVAEKTLRWYQEHLGDSGLVETDPKIIENYPGGRFEIVFIDHPGLWHKFSHPGIERARRMLGLNAFLAIALDGFYASVEACDYTHSLDSDVMDSENIRRACQAQFWDEERQYFADCRDEENALLGWSAQSQVLAILAGIVTGEDARALMERLIADRKNPQLCRCTPYFWVYFAEALILTGHEDDVVPLMQEAWAIMSDDPETTTWWESFEGRDTDTRCHPWSAVPAWILHGEGLSFRLCGEPGVPTAS